MKKSNRRIEAFSTEDAPISVGLIFDSSESMSNKIQKSKEAALQFFRTSNPQDEFMLISFSDRPNLITGFTAKFENIQDRLLFVKVRRKNRIAGRHLPGAERDEESHDKSARPAR